MCYTSDEYAKPKTEVTYNAKLPYGTDGYRTGCNNIPVSWLATSSSDLKSVDKLNILDVKLFWLLPLEHKQLSEDVLRMLHSSDSTQNEMR